MSIGIRVVSESHKATAGFPVVSDPADPPAAQVPVDASSLLPATELTVTLSVDQGASATNTVETGEAFLVDSVDVEVAPMALGARDARADGFVYDEAGRMVPRTVDGVSTALVWDVMSNLVQSDGAGGHVVYVYDASGQRVVQVRLADAAAGVTGTATAYVASGEVTDPDTSASSTGVTIATRYYRFGGSTVAVRTDDGQLSLLLGDEQGSTSVKMPVELDGSGAMVPAVLADAAGVVRTAYTPYGQLRGADNVAVDRGWLGQVEDSGTGLTYLNARYYDPALQRFLSPDPLMNPGDPRTLDAYRYAENNPVAFTDASGLCSTTGNWAYVGGVLEPPCNKSNGTRYAAAAPTTPDVFHGDNGWRQTGGAAGAFPTEAPKKMRENINQGMAYMPASGVAVCDRYLCGYEGPPVHIDTTTPGPNRLWDRLATFAQYVGQRALRNSRNPVQQAWDFITLTSTAEVGVATVQIWIFDAELRNEEPCGSTAECLIGGWGPRIQGGTDDGEIAAFTVGHTVSFPEGIKISDVLVAHEIDGHVRQFERLGGVSFALVYFGDYAVRKWVLSDEDAYYNNTLEREAREHGNP